MRDHKLTYALVRHGQSVANTRGVFVGLKTDAKLSELGFAQAKATADYLKGYSDHITAIYASPLSRAHKTAEIIAGQLNLSVQIDDNLVEFDFGDFDGKSIREVMVEHPEVNKLWNPKITTPLPGGESAASVATRMGSAFNRIAEVHDLGELVVIVSHMGALAMRLAAMVGEEDNAPSFGSANCGVTWLEIKPEVRLLEFNHTAHINEAGLETTGLMSA